MLIACMTALDDAIAFARAAERRSDGLFLVAGLLLGTGVVEPQPALHVAGWFDIFLAGGIDTFRRLSALGRAEQHLLYKYKHATNRVF